MSVPVPHEVIGLAFGPGGELWFGGAAVIGRIDVARGRVEQVWKWTGAAPCRLAAGADGRLLVAADGAVILYEFDGKRGAVTGKVEFEAAVTALASVAGAPHVLVGLANGAVYQRGIERTLD